MAANGSVPLSLASTSDAYFDVHLDGLLQGRRRFDELLTVLVL